MSRSAKEARLHRERKAREMAWSRTPNLPAIPLKGRTRSAGRAFSREMRDNQFKGGTSVSIETNPLGVMDAFGRVHTPPVIILRTGRTWVRKGVE